MDRELDQAYAYCRSITRERAKNFYYAFITLPTAKRRAIYAAYAFCRLCDDDVDDVTDVDEKLRLLAEQREGLARTYVGAPEGRVFVALQDVISAYNIPREYLEEVINGVEMDISKARYPTFEELEEYCYRVASAVGLICIEIFGYKDPCAREHAVDWGLHAADQHPAGPGSCHAVDQHAVPAGRQEEDCRPAPARGKAAF